MSWVNRVILLVLLLVGIPYYWLMLDNSAPPSKPQPVSIAQLRALANAAGDRGPERIRFELVATSTQMGNRIAAGTGLRSAELYVLSYLLEYAAGDPVLIGGGMTSADAQQAGMRSFSRRAQARIEKALGKAQMLIPLSQIPEQLGALHMIAGTAKAKALDANLAAQQAEDRKGAPHKVAPGVVVVPAPQLRVGARMIYVQLASGREYLFAGSVSPTKENWLQQRLPARLVTDFGRKEDRSAMRSWLITLRALKRQAPGLMIVSGNRVPRGAGMQHYFDESANTLS
jgi:hypothetical protein